MDSTQVYFLIRDRSGDDLRNPGHNLYVTGLSTRVTEADLENFFSKEGKVWSWSHWFPCYLLIVILILSDYLFIMWKSFWHLIINFNLQVQSCHVVLDPRTKESRGFAFVTMDSVEDARRSIKYLHRTVLEGRLVTVEKVWYLSLHTNLNDPVHYFFAVIFLLRSPASLLSGLIYVVTSIQNSESIAKSLKPYKTDCSLLSQT